MTNDEAIKILKGAIKKPNTEDTYMGQALSMAIKSLELQSKIKTILERPDTIFHVDASKYKSMDDVIKDSEDLSRYKSICAEFKDLKE